MADHFYPAACNCKYRNPFYVMDKSRGNGAGWYKISATAAGTGI